MGRGPGRARSAPSPARRGRSAGASRRTRTRRGCAPTTASATGSTRSSSTPPGTSCSGPASASARTRCPWREPQPGAHVARAAMFVSSQAEAGVGCPLSMTYSAIPALRKQPELAAEWEPRFTSLGYDGELRPAADKPGALCGMGMTEKQGGSDVRANTTVAAPAERRRPGRRVRAHRPQVVHVGADVRRLPRPRPGRRRPLLLPDAALHPRRRAQPRSASSASRTSSATARTPPARSSSAAPGRGWSARRVAGVPTIIEMVNHTRLDCVPRRRRRDAGRRRRRRSTTPRSARPSASC